MKTTELMVGDWVSCGGTPIRVENIHGDCINFQHDIPYVQEEFMIKYSEVEPIPLTAEILEKNGFEYDPSFHTWIYDEFTINHGYLMGEDYNEHLFVFVADVHVVITYVHELQNVLRLCGMNDLADNFKINNYE